MPLSSWGPWHRIQGLSPDEADKAWLWQPDAFTPVQGKDSINVKAQLKKRTRDSEVQYFNSKRIKGLFNGSEPPSKPMQRMETFINPY